MSQGQTPAGWYHAEGDPPGTTRYWDGSQWVGEKTIVQRMLGNAAELTTIQWIRLNQMWIVFFIFVGGVNLYVAYSFSEEFWVKFKLFGMLGITLVFVIIQSIWLTMTAQNNDSAKSDSEA